MKKKIKVHIEFFAEHCFAGVFMLLLGVFVGIAYLLGLLLGL